MTYRSQKLLMQLAKMLKLSTVQRLQQRKEDLKTSFVRRVLKRKPMFSETLTHQLLQRKEMLRKTLLRRSTNIEWNVRLFRFILFIFCLSWFHAKQVNCCLNITPSVPFNLHPVSIMSYPIYFALFPLCNVPHNSSSSISATNWLSPLISPTDILKPFFLSYSPTTN